MGKTVIHFGGGALGRGLVIPMLVDSGYQVILVDTNEALLKTIRKKMSYTLDVSDAQENRYRTIPLQDALSSVREEEKLISLLKQTDTITTSVRRENLKYVAATLLKAWKDVDTDEKRVICCENIEHVGSYFQSLLLGNDLTAEQEQRLRHIRIPDTIVDRICSSKEDLGVVTGERFHECSVDRNVLPQTGMEYITSVYDIGTRFARKRYLMNSYADAVSFFALSKGKKYLYEAAGDDGVNATVAPFLTLLKNLLNAEYGIAKEELDYWADCYRRRLANPEIPRELGTVARNLFPKLSLEERFVYPLLRSEKFGVPTDDGLVFLKELIQTANGLQESPLAPEELILKLEKLWCGNADGNAIFQKMAGLMKEGPGI
ncbi:hypothetical protein ACRQU7_00295 [Caproiciproducens sp. R1]|uniref:hypothetical protein n=1 Tax=Caproiciproducens sp. R1 TaxID=3435000 RepID=UPI0040337DD8